MLCIRPLSHWSSHWSHPLRMCALVSIIIYFMLVSLSRVAWCLLRMLFHTCYSSWIFFFFLLTIRRWRNIQGRANQLWPKHGNRNCFWWSIIYGRIDFMRVSCDSNMWFEGNSMPESNKHIPGQTLDASSSIGSLTSAFEPCTSSNSNSNPIETTNSGSLNDKSCNLPDKKSIFHCV